jgi:tetratricopeptide (TPR) repeat protein
MSPSGEYSPAGPPAPGQATLLLRQACQDQVAGRMREAAEGFAAAIDQGQAEADRSLVAEAMRRLAVLHHLRSEPQAAHHYAEESLRLAQATADPGLQAEALNCLAGFATEAGDLAQARRRYHEALGLSSGAPQVAARVEQNLGMLANIEGDLERAFTHYRRALASYATLADQRGCAMVYHNLGMLCADRRAWEEAHRHFSHCRELARALGDRHLEASCMLNHCEVYLAQKRYDESRQDLLAALDLFDRIDSRGDKAAAYRMLGIGYRELGRLALAESRLRSAVEIAASAGVPLEEAEACLELARLYQRTHRTREALRYAGRARTLFERLGARADLVLVGELEQQLAA